MASDKHDGSRIVWSCGADQNEPLDEWRRFYNVTLFMCFPLFFVDVYDADVINTVKPVSSLVYWERKGRSTQCIPHRKGQKSIKINVKLHGSDYTGVRLHRGQITQGSDNTGVRLHRGQITQGSDYTGVRLHSIYHIERVKRAWKSTSDFPGVVLHRFYCITLYFMYNIGHFKK